MNTLLLWLVFNLGVLALLALDLGLFNRRPHSITMKEAAVWSSVWIILALLFNAGLFLWRGPEAALEFFTAYILEKSLSADNLFVFSLIFSYAQVPAPYQHKVLYWGVLGALITRGTFILAGVELVSRFRWSLYVLGTVLLIAGYREFRKKRPAFDAERPRLLRWVRRILPVTDQSEGGAFFLRREGRTWATPLLLALVLIEASDVVFAADSIPAILTITEDPFTLYTSNVFAILGLRSLYFLLADAVVRYQHFRTGLALVFMFVGVKILATHWVKVPVVLALAVILSILGAAVLLSLLAGKKRRSEAGRP